MPNKTIEGLIHVGTAFEVAEERASFRRSRCLPLNIRECLLGGVATGVLYGLDLGCGPVAFMRSERSQVAVLFGGAVAADVIFEGLKGAAGYAGARLEDDLRAFAVLDQRCCKLTVVRAARGEPLLEFRRLDVLRPEPSRPAFSDLSSFRRTCGNVSSAALPPATSTAWICSEARKG